MIKQLIILKDCNLKGTVTCHWKLHAKRARIGSTHVAHHVCAAIPFYKAPTGANSCCVVAGNSMFFPMLFMFFMFFPYCSPGFLHGKPMFSDNFSISFPNMFHTFPYVFSMVPQCFPSSLWGEIDWSSRTSPWHTEARKATEALKVWEGFINHDLTLMFSWPFI